MEENIIYEEENGAPEENWDDEIILVRDGKGNILEVNIPDDE